MKHDSTAQELQKAFGFHRDGRLGEAEQIYRRVVDREPKNANALQLLGVIALQSGRVDEAIEMFRRAIVVLPAAAEIHLNLGNALREKGMLEESVLAYGRAIALKPKYVQAQNNLGNALHDLGRLDEAIAAYREALANSAGMAETHDNLGRALHDKGRLEEAVAEFAEALRLKPGFGKCINNLGNVLRDQWKMDGAIAAYREALRLEPGNATYHNNLGIALREYGMLDDAVGSFRRAIALRRDYSDAHNNLGIAFRDQGLIGAALEECREAVRLSPQSAGFHSNLILIMHYDAESDERSLLAESRAWARKFAEPVKGLIGLWENDRTPDRRLRIGYVSPDFRVHPVGRFIAPLLENHDAEQVEIFCYAQVGREDEITRRIRRASRHWRNTVGMSDERMAELVREDRIDILIDLAAHSGCNRLVVFARKPAPVQVTYLAYPGTTGLETMDYRVTDSHLDPDESSAGFYSEKSIRIETYWCYEPPMEIPERRTLPALGAGFITFGCLNNFCKVSPAAVRAWCSILGAVPDSRLHLHASPGSHRERLLEMVRDSGVDPGRVTFVGKLPLEVYLREYCKIDIGLDPFPYVGGTTTCDALWMGVPVITLRGKTAISRGGVSICSNIGLGELIAADVDDYVRRVVEVAGDVGRLKELRMGLRERMRSSPLMDAARFAKQMEAAYREMWGNWCVRQAR